MSFKYIAKLPAVKTQAKYPLYSTFVYLYREGLNSSSIAYGFLCFYRIIEGIRKMRDKRAAEGDHRRYDNEKVEGEMTRLFEEKFHGKRFGYVIEKMTPMRDKVAHAFLGGREGPEVEEFDSLEKRLELEAQLSPLRSQARDRQSNDAQRVLGYWFIVRTYSPTSSDPNNSEEEDERRVRGQAAAGYDHGYDTEVFYLGLALDPKCVKGSSQGAWRGSARTTPMAKPSCGACRRRGRPP